MTHALVDADGFELTDDGFGVLTDDPASCACCGAQFPSPEDTPCHCNRCIEERFDRLDSSVIHRLFPACLFGRVVGEDESALLLEVDVAASGHVEWVHTHFCSAIGDVETLRVKHSFSDARTISMSIPKTLSAACGGCPNHSTNGRVAAFNQTDRQLLEFLDATRCPPVSRFAEFWFDVSINYQVFIHQRVSPLLGLECAAEPVAGWTANAVLNTNHPFPEEVFGRTQLGTAAVVSSGLFDDREENAPDLGANVGCSINLPGSCSGGAMSGALRLGKTPQTADMLSIAVSADVTVAPVQQCREAPLLLTTPASGLTAPQRLLEDV